MIFTRLDAYLDSTGTRFDRLIDNGYGAAVYVLVILAGLILTRG